MCQNALFEWSYEQVRVPDDTSVFSLEGKFKVQSTTDIEWIQPDGSTMFSISSVQGSWSDMSKDGSVIYKVKIGLSSGIIRFSRINSTLLIEMDIDNPSNRPNAKYIFENILIKSL